VKAILIVKDHGSRNLPCLLCFYDASTTGVRCRLLTHPKAIIPSPLKVTATLVSLILFIDLPGEASFKVVPSSLFSNVVNGECYLSLSDELDDDDYDDSV